MKKTLLLVKALTPLWLCAQHRVIELTTTSGNMSSHVLTNINKQTFESGKLVTSFNDATPSDGSALTALSKVTFGISRVTELASEASMTNYNLYPIPVQNELHLSFEAMTSATATLQVIGLDGRIVLSSAQSVVSGSNTLHLNVSTLAQGIYICRLSYGHEHYTQQIVKQ